MVPCTERQTHLSLWKPAVVVLLDLSLDEETLQILAAEHWFVRLPGSRLT